MAFGRRKDRDQDSVTDETPTEHVVADESIVDESRPQPAVREEGPWDADELPPGDDVARVDLGSLLLAPGQGIEVQVQADPATGKITQLTLRTADSALQLQPYAAPRSGGMWADIRGQIAASVSSQGGLVEEVTGSMGVEVHAMVKPGDGSAGLSPARFVGVDGPRWFLRGVFMGAAARDSGAAAVLEEVVRGSAIRRGNEALPVGAPLPMQIPPAAQPVTSESESSAPARTVPDPFERGPEITEIR